MQYSCSGTSQQDAGYRRIYSLRSMGTSSVLGFDMPTGRHIKPRKACRPTAGNNFPAHPHLVPDRSNRRYSRSKRMGDGIRKTEASVSISKKGPCPRTQVTPQRREMGSRFCLARVLDPLHYYLPSSIRTHNSLVKTDLFPSSIHERDFNYSRSGNVRNLHTTDILHSLFTTLNHLNTHSSPPNSIALGSRNINHSALGIQQWRQPPHRRSTYCQDSIRTMDCFKHNTWPTANNRPQLPQGAIQMGMASKICLALQRM